MDSKHCFGLVMLLSASVLVGCGPPKKERFPVYGQVTVKGQAADEGVVRFVPVGDKDGPRASQMALIVDGKYQMDTGGGLQRGRYRVEVEVRHKTGKKIIKRMGSETAEVDETVLVSSLQHAGKGSPLEYTAEDASNRRFDIDVPAR